MSMSHDRLALRIRLKAPIGPTAARSARKIIFLLAREWGFPEKACKEIALCFSEAIQNALEHGTRERETTDVACRLTDGDMRIVIEDHGASAGNIDALEAAFRKKDDLVPDLDGERGRGIFLIRRLMDRTEMKRTKKGGVRITLIKKKI